MSKSRSCTAPSAFVGWTTVRRINKLMPGLALCGLLAVGAIKLGNFAWLQSHGMSALTVAIVLGVIVGNTVFVRMAGQCGSGVGFSKRTLLRLGIILYGFRLTFQDVAQVGLAGVVVDALVLTSTFTLALVVGTRIFRLERNTALLIGAGSAICGAAAVMATEPVVRGRAEQVTVAVSTVVVFGTLAIFLYPLLYRLNLQWRFLPTSSSAFGMYAGSTIHEVAQVVAAGRAINQEATNTAVIAKMVRVMMLAPFLTLLSAAPSLLGCGGGASVPKDKPVVKLTLPWFAFAFIAVVAFNSRGLLPNSASTVALDIDTVLLTMAMAALGLTTHVSAIRSAGLKPLLLASLLFAWLICGGAMINRVVADALA